MQEFLHDGFPVTAAEPWYRQKMQTIQDYLAAYVGQLAGRVDEFTVVDLFAGNGLYSLGTRRERFAGSALATLAHDLPVQRYIFCEGESDQLSALKVRINRYYRGKHVVLLDGKPDQLAARIKLYAPASRQDYQSGLFCIADGFSMNASFSLIKDLSDHGFSFLIPFTFPLNDQINHEHYLTEERQKLALFLGGEAEVRRLDGHTGNNFDFYRKVVRQYEASMLSLGYSVSSTVHKIDSGLMEVPHYYIGFFTRNLSARSVTHLVQAGQAPQLSMFG